MKKILLEVEINTSKVEKNSSEVEKNTSEVEKNSSEVEKITEKSFQLYFNKKKKKLLVEVFYKKTEAKDEEMIS